MAKTYIASSSIFCYVYPHYPFIVLAPVVRRLESSSLSAVDAFNSVLKYFA